LIIDVLEPFTGDTPHIPGFLVIDDVVGVATAEGVGIEGIGADTQRHARRLVKMIHVNRQLQRGLIRWLPAHGHPSRPVAFLPRIELGGFDILRDAVPLVEQGVGADCKAVPHGHVDHALKAHEVVIARPEPGRAFQFFGGRSVGHQADHARRRIAAKQGALGSAQYLDALHVRKGNGGSGPG